MLFSLFPIDAATVPVSVPLLSYPTLYCNVMSGINKVMLVGHLGKDPELRTLGNQVAVVSFPLATSEYITKSGVKSEQTEWHNVVMWRGMAESAARILKKGKLVFIEGKVRTRKFDDKAGITKYITEIVAESFTLLGRSSDFDEDQAERRDNDPAS